MLLTEELQVNAGLNPADDRYKAGYISCIKDVLNANIETKEESQ